MNYSQNDEQQAITTYFHGRPPARFLDIGAHDGVTLSNTRALAEFGWGGVCVEPSPAPFCKLMDAYRDRSDVQLVHAALGVRDLSLMKMSDSRGDFVSTFSDSHRQLWEQTSPHGGGVTFQDIYVSAIHVDTLLRVLPGPYPFVNLDVEGINLELFHDLQLKKMGVEMICVEYEKHLAAMDEHAGAQGYKRFHTTTENALYVKR